MVKELSRKEWSIKNGKRDLEKKVDGACLSED